MSLDDVTFWIDSYNRWVEVWNRHETSKDLPLNPEWPEADKVANIGYIPTSVLAFIPKGAPRLSGPLGFIRIKGWKSYYDGWSLCRNQADASNIIWAGWRRSH
ncbi:MAG: hypothetical protein KGK01_00085 [Bradyrhizobium sp.]|nr:hypothetical protein [Bradyrhizobium sp.]MDE2240874.1 hypothetical protein [Bradyrhizobium sp.]